MGSAYILGFVPEGHKHDKDMILSLQNSTLVHKWNITAFNGFHSCQGPIPNLCMAQMTLRCDLCPWVPFSFCSNSPVMASQGTHPLSSLEEARAFSSM